MKKLIVLVLVIATLFCACSCTLTETCHAVSAATLSHVAAPSAFLSAEHDLPNHKELLHFSPTATPVPEAPVTEAPVPEAPVTEAPVTEAPVTEAPVTEAPVTEAPVTEAPVTEAPEIERPEDTVSMQDQVLAFAIECIEADLFYAGYDVFEGFTTIDGSLIYGLIFTDYTPVSDDAGDKFLYEAGFIQLEVADTPVARRITSEDVSNGLFAVDGVYEEDIYLVTYAADVQPWSGVVADQYFHYAQTSDHLISISVSPEKTATFREDIDLYDYNNGYYIFKGDLTFQGVSAMGFYGDEERFASAVQTMSAISALQDAKGYQGESVSIVVMSVEVLNEYLLNSQQGLVNGYSLEDLASIPLGPDEFVVMTPEGPGIFPSPPSHDELATQRALHGLMNIIGGAVVLVAVAVSIGSMGTATPVAVAVVGYVSGAIATVYGVSNIIQGSQDLILGIRGDIVTESVNPLLDGLKSVMGDDEKATRIYHGIGAASTWLTTLCVPVAGAISSATAANTSVGAAVVRALAVEVVKDGIIGAASAAAGLTAQKITLELTDSEAWAEFAGFSAAFATGILTACGVEKLDVKYNVSGIHRKPVSNGESSGMEKFDPPADSDTSPSVKEGDFGHYKDMKKRLHDYKDSLKNQLQQADPDSAQAALLRAQLEEANSWQIHHVTAQGRFGISRDEGYGIVIRHGWHKQTFTYGRTKDPFVSAHNGKYNNSFYNTLSPNDALRIDMANLRAILKNEGVYPKYESTLAALEETIKATFPHVFGP